MNRPLLILTTVLTLTTSCSLTGGNTHVPNRYFDFGPHIAQIDRCDRGATIDSVSASPSLQGSRMWYRYSEAPYEPVPYAISQWSAPPGVLAKRLLESAFLQDPQPGDLGIELKIHQLELQIDSVDKAQVYLSVRAKLRRYDEQVVTRTFSYSMDSLPSPGGAAKNSSAALNKLAVDLCTWVSEYKQESGL